MSVKIIIGQPFADYKKDRKSISGSGLKKMIVNPMKYWDYAINPNPAQDKDTPQMLLGRGYHARVAEGLETFKRQFYCPPQFVEEIDGLPVLDTVSDIESHLERQGIAFKKSWSKAEKWAAVPFFDGKKCAVLWDEFKAELAEKNSGKTAMTREAYDEIIRNVDILSNAESFAEIFNDGLPEVTIEWDEDGLRHKARIDRVTKNRLHEVKTISNSMEKDFEKAVICDIGQRRYNVSAVHYIKGWRKVLEAWKENRLTIEIQDNTPQDFVEDILKSFNKEWQFEFLFIQTGDVPFYLVREFAERDWNMKRNGYWHYADMGRDYAIKEIKRLSEIFGDSPWLESQIKKPLDDADFPLWMVE